MAKLNAKVYTTNKPIRSISSDDIIEIDLSHKNRQLATIRLIIQKEDGAPVIEYMSPNDTYWQNIVTEQKPKATLCYCQDSGLSSPHYQDDHK